MGGIHLPLCISGGRHRLTPWAWPWPPVTSPLLIASHHRLDGHPSSMARTPLPSIHLRLPQVHLPRMSLPPHQPPLRMCLCLRVPPLRLGMRWGPSPRRVHRLTTSSWGWTHRPRAPPSTHCPCRSGGVPCMGRMALLPYLMGMHMHSMALRHLHSPLVVPLPCPPSSP